MLYGGLSPLVQRNRTRRCSSNASVSLFSTSEVGQWSGAAPARASMAGWNQGKICKNRVFSVEWFIRTFWPEWLSQLISHVLQSLLRAARVYAKPPFVCYVFVNTDVSVATLFCHCSVVDWSLCGIITSMALFSWRRKPSTRSNAVFMHSIYTVYFWRMHLFGDYQIDRNLNSQVPSLTVKLFGVPLSSLRVLKSIKSVGTFQNKFTPVR